MQEKSAIAMFGFCIGAAKYILYKKSEEITTIDTVISGYMNLIMLSAISTVVPKKIRYIVIFIDLGCLSYNLYRKKKPPKYGQPLGKEIDVLETSTGAEELECASTEE